MIASRCSESDDYPVNDTDATSFKWFSSDMCQAQVNEGFAKVLLGTISYLTFDFVVLTFMYENKDKQEMQYWWHHVVTLTAMISSLAAGYGITNIGSISLLCEISTIFLNFRSAFSKEQQNSCLATAN